MEVGYFQAKFIVQVVQVQVRMTEDQGLYNKPSAAVHPGALAAGTVPQYNTRNKKEPENLGSSYERSVMCSV